jgi:hypothetical protein
MTKMQPGQIFPPSSFRFEGPLPDREASKETRDGRGSDLETPGVRQEITKYLLNARKQLLAASYQAMSIERSEDRELPS